MGRFLVLVLKRMNEFVRVVEPWGVFIGVIALILALMTFALELEDQRDERLFRAWDFLLEYDRNSRAYRIGESDVYTSPAGAVYQALEFLNRKVEGRLCSSLLKSMFQFFSGATNRECLFPSRARQSLAYRYITSVELTGIDLPEADLAYTDFSYTILSGANLENANLEGANLKYANLVGANLKYADFSEASLYYANLGGANLKSANLGGVNLKNANLANAVLVNALFTFACMENADLTDAELHTASLYQANLTNAELKNVDLSNVSFKKTNVTNANMTEAIGLTPKQLKEACVSDPKMPPKYKIQSTIDWENQKCDGNLSTEICDIEVHHSRGELILVEER